MVNVTRGTVEVTWDPEARLAVLRFDHGTRATGNDALFLVDALERWIGTDHEPFGLLCDGGSVTGVDAEYRSVCGKFFREHRDDSSLAFFNMGPILRVAAEMFRVGTGLSLKVFANEEEARAWLRERSIAA